MRFACLFALLTLATPLFAADDKDGPVYTNPSMADEDFQLQGEYRGYFRPTSSPRSSINVALQVIALGDGQFRASKYYGGLPGEGWFGGDRYEIPGERSGDILRIHDTRYEIEIQNGEGVVVDRDGREAGHFTRVQRISPTMGAPAPKGAIVLFDGTDNGSFKDAKLTEEGFLMAGTETTQAFGDFRLHGEFRLPYKPKALGQARGNSGFYLQGRYEVQVLDSFGLEGVENECGALYRTKRPDFNMCLPPLQWQTYDIDFSPAKFDESGKKVRNMQISVWHNGQLIHNAASIPNKTGAGKPEGPEALITKIQDHGNPVVYRNIWLVDRSGSDSVGNNWLKLPFRAPPVPIRLGP
ncbi:MAG: DUF1080 domain-containing protein [Planctomycetaceae bacterium]